MKRITIFTLLLLVNTITLYSQLDLSVKSASEIQLGIHNHATIHGIFNNLRIEYGEDAFQDVFYHMINEELETIFDKYFDKYVNKSFDYVELLHNRLYERSLSFISNDVLYVLTYKPVEFLIRGSPTMKRHLYLYGLDETGEWFEATDLIETDKKENKLVKSAFFPFQFNYPNQPYSYVKKLEEENVVLMYVLYHDFDYEAKGNNIGTARPYYKIITLKPKNNREFTFKKETDWDVKKYIITE